MILAHLSELHLGFRAYARSERGRNVREGDVSDVFERAVAALVDIGPDAIVVTGDVFDRPDPAPAALVTLTRGLRTLRSELPRTPLLLVAGARDTPRNRLEPIVLDAVGGRDDIWVATDRARSVTALDGALHLCLVPFRALLDDPLPQLAPDPGARWNVLAIHGRLQSSDAVGPVERSSPEVRFGPTERLLTVAADEWSYIALGGDHGAREVGDRAWYAGALERVGREPWQDPTAARGFLLWDLEARRSSFHPLRGRPVVALAPVRVPDDPEALRRRVGEVAAEVPGGISDKIVHLTLRGVPPRALLSLQGDPLAALRDGTLHVLLEVEESLVPPPDVATLVTEVAGEAEGTAPATERSASASDTLPRGLVVVLPGTSGDPRGDIEHLLGEDPGPLSTLSTGAGHDEAFRAARRTLLLAWGGTRLESSWRAVEEAQAARADALGSVERLRRIAALDGAPGELRRAEVELRRLREDHAEVAGDLEEATMDWLRERQDAETQLQAYRDHARELKARLSGIDGAGADAPCPTCGRTLGDHLDQVVRQLRDEWEAVVQDGRWWKRRREQLELKPEPLQALESRSVRLQAAMESQAERVERDRSRVRRLDELKGAGHPEGAVAAALAALEGEAGGWVLARASILLNRLSGGRIIALGEATPGRVRLEGWNGRLLRPIGEDIAAATVALVLAGASCASQVGGFPATLVLADAFDRLGAEDQQRAVDLLMESTPRVGRIVLVTGSDIADRRPEAFDAVLRLGPDRGVSLDPRPATLRID